MPGVRYRRLGSSDSRDLGDQPRLVADLRRRRRATTRREACVDAAFDAGINFIDTANVYARGAAESFLGDVLAGAAARLLRARDEALLPDGRRATRASRASRSEADRRLARAPAHRLRRPLPVPPLRPRDAARGDDGGARPRSCAPARRATSASASGRADADPGVARPEPRARLREVRLVAAAVLDALARARARGDPALRGERHLADRLVAARPGRADRQVPPGRAAARRARARRASGWAA